MPKPQLQFRTKVDNFSTTPWAPNLRHKYNAKVPLGYNLRSEEEEVDSEEQTFRAEEEEAEMEEKDLAQLLAEAYATLGELALTEEGKKEYSKKAREEARRAGKIELLEDDLGDEEEMNVD